jgi:hypothetical protein
MPYIRIAAFFDKVLASTLGARFEEIYHLQSKTFSMRREVLAAPPQRGGAARGGGPPRPGGGPPPQHGAAARRGRAAAPQNTTNSHSETLCIELADSTLSFTFLPVKEALKSTRRRLPIPRRRRTPVKASRSKSMDSLRKLLGPYRVCLFLGCGGPLPREQFLLTFAAI